MKKKKHQKTQKRELITSTVTPGDSVGQAGLTTESYDLGLSLGHFWFPFVVPSQFGLPMISSLLLWSSRLPLD